MGFKSRKIYVGLISLAVVLAAYLLYTQLTITPQIDIDTEGKMKTPAVLEENAPDQDGKIGMIGEVGVGTVRKAKYIHLNAEKQVDREFGFEKLLHQEEEKWEIEKPYMNVFRPNFNCYITADRGNVRVEDVAGRPDPKDATLTGNVVIHILPQAGSNVKEGFIYLDDVDYISEEAQFSTDGPVKFVSQDANMLGRGLELVYNDELDRLEFLRIIHLESLWLRPSSQTSLFSPGPTDADSKTDTTGQVQTKTSDEPLEKVGRKTKQTPPEGEQAGQQKKGEYYRCVFSDNVVIDSPEQLILADEVCINDIFWSKTSSKKPEKTDTLSTDNEKMAEETAKTSKHSNTKTVSIDKMEANDIPVEKQNQAEQPTKEIADIVVTCDNGIIVTPMSSPQVTRKSAKLDTVSIEIESKSAKSLDDTSERTKFIAQRIDYSASLGDTVATGPSELTFYVSDTMASESNEPNVPVKVTAQQKAKFLPALNQAVFEGDCLCSALRAGSAVQWNYMLAAPKLTVSLSSSKDEQSSDLTTGIEHLTADGGLVQLATVKTKVGHGPSTEESQNIDQEKLLGFTKLKCHKFDYDAAQKLCVATGPGLIAVDNSKIEEPKQKLDRFSLQKQCYAVVQEFETLKYFLDANRIIADAQSNQILIDYFPIVKGQLGQQVSVTAAHIEALMYETDTGRIELSNLTATGGITYQEQSEETKHRGRDIQFVGSQMFYDAAKSIITAQGNESQPCYFNGALVDAIEYDLKTTRVKTKITGPGILQLGR